MRHAPPPRGIVLAHQTDFDGWRAAARALALEGTPPNQVVWSVREQEDLFSAPPPAPDPTGTFSVPRALVTLAETVIQARDAQRFSLLYRLVWRAHRGERHLLDLTSDIDVRRAQSFAQSVRRDTHKMRAFLRFREVANTKGGGPDDTRHVAWFEPAHYIVEANAGFFVRRFATMAWSILTPDRCAHWDGDILTFTDGAGHDDVPIDDALEPFWRAYFKAIFNPARLKVAAMTSEMPKKYWKNMPEAQAIPELIRAAQVRTKTMVDTPIFSPERELRVTPTSPEAIAPLFPDHPDKIAAARYEAEACKACKLWQPATQTVFGEGPIDARMMLVGEQPGDQEDLAGRPFVGPAGKVLDAALAEAGVDRARLYVTNAVKHFKFEPRGKRRIHQKPDNSEIAACKFWLDLERREIKPKLVVLLGATASRAVLGRDVTISRERGRPIPLDGGAQALITVHPSYLLRLPDEASKAREYQAFVTDLRTALGLLTAA